MTKALTNTIKKLVSSFCSCYYQSKTKRLIRVLNTLSANSIRTPFQIERKIYQGFVHRTYLIFG